LIRRLIWKGKIALHSKAARTRGSATVDTNEATVKTTAVTKTVLTTTIFSFRTITKRSTIRCFIDDGNALQSWTGVGDDLGEDN